MKTFYTLPHFNPHNHHMKYYLTPTGEEIKSQRVTETWPLYYTAVSDKARIR